MLFVQFEGDNEAASFARFTFYADGALVKLNDPFRQCQPDACTGSGIQRVEVLGLVEAVEYLINLRGGNARAGVFYFDYGIVFLLRYIDRDSILSFSML